MDHLSDFAPAWTCDQPFDNPVELTSFIWLPENDGPEFALARRVIEIGRLARRQRMRIPAAALLQAIGKKMANTHDWLLGLSPTELDEYVWDMMQ